MKIKFIVTGKTDKDYLKEGIGMFHRRIEHYLPFEYIVIPDLKNSRNLSVEQQKTREGELLAGRLRSDDELVILDEKGRELSSQGLADFIAQKMVGGTKKLVFAIGGPYGFSDDIRAAATARISLSRMTFSHQMVRLIFSEQLYRALTIIKGEPYHHG